MRHAYVVLTLATLLAAPALAAPSLQNLGTHIHGPQLTMEDLNGHVYIVEKWATSG